MSEISNLQYAVEEFKQWRQEDKEEIARLKEALDVAVEALGATWPNMFPEIQQHHKSTLDKIKQIRENK